MNSAITIPASYKFLIDNGKFDAIETIVKQKKIPSDLSWREIGDYYSARLASQIMRHEYFSLLRNICDATWGKSVAENLKKSKPFSSNEYSLDECTPQDWLSPDSAWSAGTVYSFYRLIDSDINLLTMTLTAPDDGVTAMIACSLRRNNDESINMDAVDFDKNLWKKDPDDDTRYISKVVGKVDSDGTRIIVDDLQRASESAISSICNWMAKKKS